MRTLLAPACKALQPNILAHSQSSTLEELMHNKPTAQSADLAPHCLQGIATIRMLRQLEQRTGKPIRELFDLVCGTSTGGILAVALSLQQLTLDDCEDIYRWHTSARHGPTKEFHSLFRTLLNFASESLPKETLLDSAISARRTSPSQPCHRRHRGLVRDCLKLIRGLAASLDLVFCAEGGTFGTVSLQACVDRHRGLVGKLLEGC